MSFPLYWFIFIHSQAIQICYTHTHTHIISIVIAETTHFGVTIDLHLEIGRKSNKDIIFVGKFLLFSRVADAPFLHVYLDIHQMPNGDIKKKIGFYNNSGLGQVEIF